MKNEKTPEELKRAIEKKDYIDRKVKEIETKAAAVKKELLAMRSERTNSK